MKVKTSITINYDLLQEIDNKIKNTHNRSQFIETAIQYYLQNYYKSIRDNKDLEIINNKSDSLNAEAEEILSYQDW